MEEVKKYWTNFKYLGTEDDIPEDEIRRLVLSNQVYLAALIVCLAFTILFTFTGALEAAILTGIGLLTMVFCLFLNYKKRGLLSRKISIYIPTVLYTLGGIFYGESLGFQYGFLTLLLIPLLYFNRKKDFIPYYLWCFLNIIVLLYFFTYHEPLIGAMNETFGLKLAVYFNNVFLMLIIISTFYSITAAYQNKNVSLLEQLKEKNNELEQFVYMASHDLKEPIRTISAYSSLLDKKISTEEDEDVGQFLFFIRDGANRMNKLLTDLLDFSTVGKHKIELEKIDLDTIISEVNENLKLAIHESQTEIISQALPEIMGSSSLMLQLFQNIIANSIKYRKKKEKSVIRISTESVDEKIRVQIADEGIGMKQKDLAQVFKPFYKIHGKSEYAGSGIGLSTCKKICDLLNAKIWMTSTFNEGSTTYLEFNRI